jgi:hypothetical protein
MTGFPLPSIQSYLAIDNRLLLTNQLGEPLLSNYDFALGVNVAPVRDFGRLSIDHHAEIHGCACS